MCPKSFRLEVFVTTWSLSLLALYSISVRYYFSSLDRPLYFSHILSHFLHQFPCKTITPFSPMDPLGYVIQLMLHITSILCLHCCPTAQASSFQNLTSKSFQSLSFFTGTTTSAALPIFQITIQEPQSSFPGTTRYKQCLCMSKI